MKQRDDTSFIRSLIAEGEHVRQDFKFEVSDSRKIARSLSAFANTEGGRLLIGVKDNGRIAGVRSEEEMYMVEAAAQVYCTPEVEVEMRVYRPEGRSVLIASVEPAPHKPVMVKEEGGRKLAYVRIADENILASPVHLGVWRCEADNVRGGGADRVLPGNILMAPDSGLREGPVSVVFTEQERELLAVIAAASVGLAHRSAQSGLPAARTGSCTSVSPASPVSSCGLTLQQICRRVTIPRRRVIHLLSLFVHWGLVGIRHDSRGFLYYACDACEHI